MPKKETADSIQPHTEEKLQFYTKYLERYLQILLRAKGVEKINIYDMCCGAGIYSDGKVGSAIRAVDSIWRIQQSNKLNRPINLHLNDLVPKKTEQLKRALSSRNSEEKNFRISYSNLEASDLLHQLAEKFFHQNNKVRNIIFIDPYGYKMVDRENLKNVLSGGKTEIILFLPIEQMYRFRVMTLDSKVDNPYKPLKKFVEQFNIDVESIHNERAFIKALESALTFDNQLCATSYAIKNHTGHYYGMFFII